MAERLQVFPSRLEGMDRSVPVWVMAALTLALLILLPLGWLAYVSVSSEAGVTLAHYRKVFTDPHLQKALWKTAELSYGDKRKLEIALALCLRPSVLLLDEPFAGLSDVEIVEVLELIRRVRKEFTLVIIEHKISRIVDLVSRLSVMHEGKLIAEGGPAEVLADPLVRQVYWGRP